jgi:Tol biopolymer transport system component
MRLVLPFLGVVLVSVAWADPPTPPSAPGAPAAPEAPAKSPALERAPEAGERHFGSLRQLTFGGENAEAYWSHDEKRLVFQSTRPPYTADQIFTMDADGSNVRLVSTGKGRTTCSFFLPGDERILYSSTHLGGDQPPTPPRYDPKIGYVWPVWASYDIFTAKADGSDLRRLTETPGYDAEAVVSPKGDRIVFTSARDGDLELYTMKLDGTDVRRVTETPGYDGGAFFSWDGTKLCYRSAWREGADTAEDRALLQNQLVKPTMLEIFVCDADGKNREQLTKNGAANFGPFWHPDGKRIVFSSNVHDPKGGNFELYLVDVATKAVERVTFFERRREGARRSDDFDGFPMFTRDGKRLVFCSNRHNANPNETNVFVADWRD